MIPPRIVIHVPHASVHVPEDVRRALLLDDEALRNEVVAMTDHDTDALFSVPTVDALAVVFPVSRLVVDPERFTDDDQEPMAERGMGVVYTRTSDGRPLRHPPTPEERSRLLTRFYEPHHARLTAAVSSALGAHGSCLVLDGHSFPSRSLPYELDQRQDRPEICIGTDPEHTPSWLRDSAVGAFEAEDFRVAIDRPFAGALVPMAFYRRDRRVLALMVEVNRGLYLDERSGVRLAVFEDLRSRLTRALEAIAGSLRTFP